MSDTNLIAACHDQADALVSKLATAEDGNDLVAVVQQWTFCSPVWRSAPDCTALDVIVKEAVRKTAARLLAQEEAYLAGIRKNDKTRVSTERNITTLKYVRDITT